MTAQERVDKLARWLDRWQPPETAVIGSIAIGVGLLSGIGVWAFKQLIELTHQLAFVDLGGALNGISPWAIAAIPVIGGLIAGLLAHFFIGEERHHGVAGIMEAVALAGGRLHYARTPIKAIAAALGIGFGASVGPEDPSVQIGANVGSMVGQVFHLSDERTRALVAAGAAGGIAAAFNAPIAGVFFALEIVLGEFTGNAMGVVVLASVISAVFTQAVSGAQPAFRVPAYAFNSEWELAFYLGLGLLAGPVAALYVRLLYRFSDLLHGWRAPRWLKPVLAGLLIGLVGIFLPQVFGVGYDTIEGVIGGKPYALGLLGLLLVAKIFLTPISIGSGFQGGVFAPALYLGAMLGGAFAMVMNLLVPAAHLNPAAFAMVGMAAVLAGAVHAPLTAIILLFEMTNDYHIILPLMFAVIVSLFVSQLLQRQSMYDLSLSRKGIQLQRGRDVEVLEAITVGEVMRDEVDTLNDFDSLHLAMDRFTETRHHGLAVLDKNGKLAGVITVQDLEQGRISPDADMLTVGDVMSRDLLVTYPDETIGDALRRMGLRDIGRLPVVSPDKPTELLGVLTRTDLVRAYDVALTRRAAMRHKAHQVRLGAVSGVSVEEVTIQQGAECDGKRVSEVEWPTDCVLATIRRGRKVIFLHGDTVLRPGDVLVAVADEDARDELEFLCTRQMVQAAIGDE